MTFAAWVTVVGALLTVLVLATYLIYVAVILSRVSGNLNAITYGIVSINKKATPVGGILKEINRDLADVDAALRAVLSKKRAPKVVKPAAPAAARPAPAHARNADAPPPWVVAPQPTRYKP